MNKILLLLLLITNFSFSQRKPKENTTHFYLENEKFYWEKVFDAPGYDKNRLQKLLLKQSLTDGANINVIEIDSTITFMVDRETINFRKHGGYILFTNALSVGPQFYNVNIDFKDFRYKVKIRNLKVEAINFFSGRLEIFDYETLLLSQKKKKVVSSQNQDKALIINNNHFIEKFTFQPPNLEKW